MAGKPSGMSASQKFLGVMLVVWAAFILACFLWFGPMHGQELEARMVMHQVREQHFHATREEIDLLKQKIVELESQASKQGVQPQSQLPALDDIDQSKSDNPPPVGNQDEEDPQAPVEPQTDFEEDTSLKPMEKAGSCVYKLHPGFLSGCFPDDENCQSFANLEKALSTCLKPGCGGVVHDPSSNRFELRVDTATIESPSGEQSYIKEISKGCNNLPQKQSNSPAPEWWKPEPGVAMKDIGTFVDGEPTIFLSIASYRDDMCHETLDRALRWAKKPNRLMFGVVEQNVPGDTPCFKTERPCEEDPEQLLCKYQDNIRIDAVNAKEGRGPTWGRHRADRLYRGEYYVLQIDAHMYFVQDWDAEVIRQFQAAKNEWAVISTYPSDNKHNIHKGKPMVRTTPGICKSGFLGDGLIRHQAAGEFYPDPAIVGNGDQPVLQPWWAAGLSFSRGHRIVQVPYDCCTPMTFNGEEFSMAFRMFTHGYDLYTFRRPIAMHPYRRTKKRPTLFWENNSRYPGLDQRSARRLEHIFGMNMVGGSDFDSTDLGRYGMGTKRPLSKFLRVFGIDFKRRTVKNLCRAVQTARLHQDLTRYLRSDHDGIDYSKVPDNIGDSWPTGGR